MNNNNQNVNLVVSLDINRVNHIWETNIRNKLIEQLKSYSKKIYFSGPGGNFYKNLALYGILVSVKYDDPKYPDEPKAYVLTFKSLLDVLNGKRTKLLIDLVENANLLKVHGFLDQENNELINRLISIAENGYSLSSTLEYDIVGHTTRLIEINTYIKENKNEY